MANPYLVALDDHYYAGANEQKIDNAFEPFRRYLTNARKALERKQVRCSWKALPQPDAVLTLKQKVFEVQPHGLIEFEVFGSGWFEITEDLDDECPLNSDFEPDFEEHVTIGKGKDRQAIPISKNDFRQSGESYLIKLNDIEAKKITWAGYSLAIEPFSEELPNTLHLKQQGTEYKVTREEGNQYVIRGTPDSSRPLIGDGHSLNFCYIQKPTMPQDAIEIDNHFYITGNNKPHINGTSYKDVSNEFLKNISPQDLMTADGQSLPTHWVLNTANKKITLDTGGDQYPQKLGHRKLLELMLTCQKDDQEACWIQLENEDYGDDNGVSQDPLEYFFDDQVDILDANEKPGNNAGYKVLRSRPEERQLLLCRKSDRKKVPTLPRHQQLTVKVNLQALFRQEEAITNLKLCPNLEHKPLLDLMKDRQRQRWPDFHPEPEQDIHWQILKDLQFDGCDRQREFVTKALATPDFAILDGPPGTGKTTTILELIIQLARRGQRILLTASTHAAINNVLERVVENGLEQEVFPLRIGDKERATGVEQFQYDEIMKEFSHAVDGDELDQLLVDSSNLICGTTMGILRLFNHKSLNFNHGTPPFDVMIIDECSKTTFAEFLVPARYAKKWVLVGDVKQLSPFTDREQITENLKQLVLRHKTKKQEEELLSPAVQRACFLLNAFRSRQDGQWGYHDRFVVPVSKGELDALASEMKARTEGGHEHFAQILLVGGTHKYQAINHFTKQEFLENSWQSYDFNLIFCEGTLVESDMDLMPADAVVLAKGWRTTSHSYRHMVRYDSSHQCAQKWANPKKNGGSYAWELHHLWQEHDKKSSWAQELVWRLEREYWLRFLSRRNSHKSDGIKKQLAQLMPKSVKADGRIYSIRNMAFPSILEALSGSGILKTKNDCANTLNQGFDAHEKQDRHTTLTYQHRMHPDISKYPREQFYSEDRHTRSLLDGSKTRSARNWSYNGYDSQAVWLDVKGEASGTANNKEAQAIIRKLKHFCAWAEHQEESYDVAVLTFYKKQEALLRSKLQGLTGEKNAYSRFKYNKAVTIKLNTVDFFQGQEADLVFLSMVNTYRDGFLDSPNRLNVSLTRARFQLVVVGLNHYYSQKSGSSELRALAQALPVTKE